MLLRLLSKIHRVTFCFPFFYFHFLLSCPNGIPNSVDVKLYRQSPWSWAFQVDEIVRDPRAKSPRLLIRLKTNQNKKTKQFKCWTLSLFFLFFIFSPFLFSHLFFFTQTMTTYIIIRGNKAKNNSKIKLLSLLLFFLFSFLFSSFFPVPFLFFFLTFFLFLWGRDCLSPIPT